MAGQGIVPRGRRAARLGGVLAAVALAALAGCRREDPNDYQHQQQRHEAAAAALRDMGAQVTEVPDPRGLSWAVTMSGKPVPDEFFDHLEKLGYITQLDLSRTNITDAQAKRLNKKEIGTLLLKLDLSHTPVTDDDLDQLDNLLLLTDLNLVGTKVTRAGVERFRTKRSSDPKIMPQFKSPKIRL
jgi:hypothetical protein